MAWVWVLGLDWRVVLLNLTFQVLEELCCVFGEVWLVSGGGVLGFYLDFFMRVYFSRLE